MKALITAVIVFVIVVLLFFVAALPVWLLWNWLMPVIFSLPKITYLQAVGLMILIDCFTRPPKVNYKEDK